MHFSVSIIPSANALRLRVIQSLALRMIRVGQFVQLSNVVFSLHPQRPLGAFSLQAGLLSGICCNYRSSWSISIVKVSKILLTPQKLATESLLVSTSSSTGGLRSRAHLFTRDQMNDTTLSIDKRRTRNQCQFKEVCSSKLLCAIYDYQETVVWIA